MALGQNDQFFYSPDARIFINSLTQGGIIEVSEDFMSLTIERNINAVSIATIYLANNGFKYTPASRDFTKANTSLPVINNMDQVVIFLKKENYYQYFTGFVTYSPIVTLIPEPIVITCSCTLYKAQNSYWDAGAIEYEGIIPGILQNSQVFGGKVQNNDGGVATGIRNLLTKVANWNEADIHIGGIPDQWVQFATNIYKQTQIQLRDQNATSFQDIINFLEVTGGTSSSITSTTTAGKTGIHDGTVSSLGAPGAPGGTAILGIASGDHISATYATSTEMNNYATKGPINTREADIIVKNSNNTQYWVAVPATYFTSKVGNESSAKTWLSGASGGKLTYPSNAQNGRLLLISNTVGGTTKQIQAHVIYAIKENLKLNGADIILSEAAFSYLSSESSANIVKNISIDGWVNPSSGQLKGGPVVKTISPTKPQTNNSTPPRHKFGKATRSAKRPISDLTSSAAWATELLHKLNVSASPNNITNFQRWITVESAGNQAGFLRDNNPLNLNTYSTAHSSLPGGTIIAEFGIYVQTFPTVEAGIIATANQIEMEPELMKVLQNNGTAAEFGSALTTTAWASAGYANSKVFPTIAPFEGSSTIGSNPNGAANTGLGNVGGNYNFNTTQGVIGFDVNSTILSGGPRAFITDVSSLSTISTLATMGLREFQSGPDGSFLAWYPDYFGLYGTAPALSIHDIEVINFSIYHDDTQLYTHVGVSGDPTEVGNVSLVDWLMTNGIVTIENNAILGLLFGSDPSTLSSSMSTLLAQGIDINTFAREFLRRYGMRPYVDSEPMIRSQLMEFMYALQEFIYLWSQQYATSVTFTFMPELYPGMLIELADHGIQVYVQSVSQSCARDGGFTTNAVVTCPTRIIGKKVVNGKTINNVVPIDFGYPIKLQDVKYN